MFSAAPLPVSDWLKRCLGITEVAGSSPVGSGVFVLQKLRLRVISGMCTGTRDSRGGKCLSLVNEFLYEAVKTLPAEDDSSKRSGACFTRRKVKTRSERGKQTFRSESVTICVSL